MSRCADDLWRPKKRQGPGDPLRRKRGGGGRGEAAVAGAVLARNTTAAARRRALLLFAVAPCACFFWAAPALVRLAPHSAGEAAISADPREEGQDGDPRTKSAFPASLYLDPYGSPSSSKDRSSSSMAAPPCRPHRVRVAQRNSTAAYHDSSNSNSSFAVVSMTLSFELDRTHCPPDAIRRIVVECEPLEQPSGSSGGSERLGSHHFLLGGPSKSRRATRRTVVVVLVAAETEAEQAEGEAVPGIPTASDTAGTATTVVRVRPIQFDYQTEEMRLHGGEIFRSDCIYHVPLDGMAAGAVRYAYRIRVFPKGQEEEQQQQRPPPAVGDGKHVDTGRRSLPREPKQRLRHGARQDGPFGVEEEATRDDDNNNNNDDDSGATSYRGEMVTPPGPHTPTRLALVGDLGQTWYSTLTMLHIWREATFMPNSSGTAAAAAAAVPVTNLVIAGDMSYADSDPQRWTSWFELMEPLLRTVPTHVAAGNHELECDADGNLFTFYEKCFASPNRIRDAFREPFPKRPWEVWKRCSHPSQFRAAYDYGNAYYSYEHGLAKVVVLSSYSRTEMNSTQYRWLRDELSNGFRRDRTPWLVVVFHSPFYTTFLGHQEESQAVTMRAAMEDLFVRHGVNLVVSGHDHAYLRTHPMYRGQVVMSGRAPVYWTLGAGGNREGHSPGYAHSVPEPWVAQRSLSDFGYGSLFLPNGTHAHLTWMRDGAGVGLKVDEMAVEDDVWIANPYYSVPSTSAVA